MRFNSKWVFVFIAFVIFSRSDVFAQSSSDNSVSAEALKQFQTRPTTKNLVVVRRLGFSLIGDSKFEQSDLVFSEILTKFPVDGLSLYGRAVSLFNLKQYREAETVLEKAEEIFEKQKNKYSLADALVLSAVISAVSGANAEAIEKLKKAVTLVPTHFDANLSLGRAFFGNGNLAASITSFRAALKQQPQNIKANFFLASALERDGNTTEALDVYRELIKIAPNLAEGYLGLGVLLINSNGANSSEGLENLLKAVEINPNLYEAQITIGKTLLRQNKAEESLIYLQRAVKMLPENPEPHYQLLQAFRKLGKKTEVEIEQAIIKKIHDNHRGSASSPSP